MTRISIILLILPVYIYSQDTESSHFKKWTLSDSFFPQYIHLFPDHTTITLTDKDDNSLTFSSPDQITDIASKKKAQRIKMNNDLQIKSIVYNDHIFYLFTNRFLEYKFTNNIHNPLLPLVRPVESYYMGLFKRNPQTNDWTTFKFKLKNQEIVNMFLESKTLIIKSLIDATFKIMQYDLKKGSSTCFYIDNPEETIQAVENNESHKECIFTVCTQSLKKKESSTSLYCFSYKKIFKKIWQHTFENASSLSSHISTKEND